MTHCAELPSWFRCKVVDITMARRVLKPDPMGYERDDEGAVDPERWVCPACSCYQSGVDACGCGLCAPCCTQHCDFIEDSVTGERASRCGNCD